MKQTETFVTLEGVKITETTAIDATGIERITKTASVKKKGRLLLYQTVRVNDGSGWRKLYARHTASDKRIRVLDIFVWIRLAFHVGSPIPKIEK